MTKQVQRSSDGGRAKLRDARLVGDIAVPFLAGSALCAGAVYALSGHPAVVGFSHETETLMRGPYGATLPLGAIAAYLVMVLVGNPLYKKLTGPGDGPALALPLFAWNVFLWLLSVMMLIGIAVPMWNQAKATGFDPHNFMCDPQLDRWHGVSYVAVYVFALSKFAELVDTVFLVVRKKPVMFLHWYHHATVLAYTWWAVSTRFSSGFVFAAVNAFVHSIMYYYYALRAINIKPPGAKYITLIQISQMVLGLAVLAAHAYFHLVDKRECPADAPMAMLTGGAVMYGSYLVLFAMFFFNRYSRPASASAKKTD